MQVRQWPARVVCLLTTVAAVMVVPRVALASTGDIADPVIRSVAAMPSSVDVSVTDKLIPVSVRVTDNVGVDSVTATMWGGTGSAASAESIELRRVSGTARDGVWQGKVRIVQGFPALTLELGLFAFDVAGNVTLVSRNGPSVVDTNPDLAMPVVTLRSPAAGARFDVRTKSGNVVMTARVRDPHSGVAVVDAYLVFPGVRAVWRGAEATRVSGTIHDGVWRAVIHLPKGLPDSSPCLTVATSDRAHNSQTSVAYRCLSRDWQAITQPPFYLQEMRSFRDPEHPGDIRIIGSAASSAPRLTGLDFSFDAATGAVHVDAALLDDERVARARLHLVRVDAAGTATPAHTFPLTLSTGTDQDGHWTVTTSGLTQWEPGTYYPVVTVLDRHHERAYSGPTLPSYASGLTLFPDGADPSFLIE